MTHGCNDFAVMNSSQIVSQKEKQNVYLPE